MPERPHIVSERIGKPVAYLGGRLDEQEGALDGNDAYQRRTV